MVYLVNSPLTTAPQARKILRFRGYLKGKIWLCYNSYRDAQKRSGPDFPNVNYGVKFLKFDSDFGKGAPLPLGFAVPPRDYWYLGQMFQLLSVFDVVWV